MRGASNGGESKPQSRDPALTWDIPPETDATSQDAHIQDLRAGLFDATAGHVEALVFGLLDDDGVQNAHIWAPLIARLSREAVEYLSPEAIRCAGGTDPRDFIKVKRTVVTDMEQPFSMSSAVNGVVCHRNVAHKRMRTSIHKPRILAVAEPLEEHDLPQDKLASFDALMDAEQQKSGKYISSIIALAPDLLLVGGGVPRAAQDLLLKAGISLVSGLKPELLSRIARCTGAKLVFRDKAFKDDFLGTCDHFDVCGGQKEPPHGSLMFFRGCPRGLGSSIVLHGPDAEELAKVKKIAQHASYVSYWNYLEAAFLAEQFLVAGFSVSAAIQAAKESASKTALYKGQFPIVLNSPHCAVYEGFETALGMFTGSQSAQRLLSASREIWLTISCRNPAKAIQCESPHLYAMSFYHEGDLPLVNFLSAAAPVNRKCPHPQCGDGASLHLRSFFHGDGLITLSSVHLPPEKSFNGGDRVWMWMRRTGQEVGSGNGPHRAPMSRDAACISFAHILALIFDSRHFKLGGLNFQRDYVRYFGFGRTIICLHHTTIHPLAVHLPPSMLHVVNNDALRWLHEEMKSLREVRLLTGGVLYVFSTESLSQVVLWLVLARKLKIFSVP